MLDDIDRDLAIRTVLSEAAGEGPQGMAAVAAVIRNRMAAGKYGGRTAAEVVTAPNQFEPWNTPGNGKKNDPLGYKPGSRDYEDAGRIVDAVFSGRVADPTGGMTHFYAPVAQAQLGRDAPKWARGPSKRIGGHMFFAPDGSVSDLAQGLGNIGQDPGAALPAPAPGAGPAPATAPMAFAGPQPSMAGGSSRDQLMALLKQVMGGSGFGGQPQQPQHGAINQLLFGQGGWQGHMGKAVPNGLLAGLLGAGTPTPAMASPAQPMQLPGMPAGAAPAGAAAGAPGLPPADAVTGGPLALASGPASAGGGMPFAEGLQSLFGLI